MCLGLRIAAGVPISSGVLVPPFLMLLVIVIPVFYLLNAIMWSLFLDADLTQSVLTQADVSEDPLKALLLCCQVLMVAVLANTLLKEFVTASFGCAIILNPKMWQWHLRRGAIQQFN
eukprot:4480931-Amphidinium_carterae.1